MNGKPAELRDTFVAFPDGSFRRVALLVGCEVWTAENEGGPFDNGNQRAERLKPQSAPAVDFCDVSAPLVPRLVGLNPDRDPELKVPAWLGLINLENHAVGTNALLASPDGRFKLHFSFEDDSFTRRPTEEGPETSSPCKGSSCVRISRRYTPPLQDITLTVELPPKSLSFR